MSFDGIINILKPMGFTSGDAVGKIKRILRKADKNIKVGHMGTLDPLGSGVLQIAVGRATKLFNYYLTKTKKYRAAFTFGITTDTLDSEDKIQRIKYNVSGRIPSREEIEKILPEFTGKQMQVPPQYSAKSVGGVRAYSLARGGKVTDIPPREIEIFKIELIEQINESTFVFDIECSGGTYIRSIARDIAKRLNTVAYMAYIIRLRSGEMKIEDSVTIQEFEQDINKNIIPLSSIEPITLALGFFDCIHRGHRAIIKKTIDCAKKLNSEASVFTFKNNPNFFWNNNLPLIYSLEHRKSLINNCGIKNIIETEIDRDFAVMPPGKFFESLINKYNIKALVTGQDYTFGFEGAGNTGLLKTLCEKHKIDLIVVPEVKYRGEKIGSSRIRECIVNGRMEEANYMLENPYELIGSVTGGKARGRDKGHPTINFNIPDLTIPSDGVYISRTYIKGKVYNSVTNIGAQPTYNESSRNIETHIIDYDGGLYGEKIRVKIMHRIRDCVKFASVDELHKQIDTDILKSVNYRKKNG